MRVCMHAYRKIFAEPADFFLKSERGIGNGSFLRLGEKKEKKRGWFRKCASAAAAADVALSFVFIKIKTTRQEVEKILCTD